MRTWMAPDRTIGADRDCMRTAAIPRQKEAAPGGKSRKTNNKEKVQ